MEIPNPFENPTDKLTTLGARVAAYTHNAGFANNDLVIALAVAKAESGWSFTVRGGPNSNGTYDYGLFQINDVHKPSAEVKTNPLANAKEAYRIYKDAGRKFTPWAAYNSGSYRQHMNAAAIAVKELQRLGSAFERTTVANADRVGENDGVADVNIDNPFDSGVSGMVSNAIANFKQAVDKTFAVIVAVVLIVLGVVLIGRTTAVGIATKGVKSVAKGALK